MKKKMIGITALTAAMALSTGMTAFAAGWVQDSNGWGYQYDNGSWATMGWFTDPETGYEYYLDPDGYMMSDTRVEGFRLGSDGRKVEKTEAEIQAEQEREQHLASRPSPSKQQTAASLAGKAAKNSNAAVTTTRLAYQAEMKTFMDKYFVNTATSLGTSSLNGRVSKDNLQTTYKLYVPTAGDVFTSTLHLNANPKSVNYVPYALEVTFNRNILHEEAEVQALDQCFTNMMIASLGETEGQAVADLIFAEEVGNGASFEASGYTDTGNSYTLSYKNDFFTMQVTCSEIVASDETAEDGAEAEAAESTEAESVEAEQAADNTSRVITAGQPASDEEDTAKTEADAEDTASETEAETATSAEGTEAETAAEGTEAEITSEETESEISTEETEAAAE